MKSPTDSSAAPDRDSLVRDTLDRVQRQLRAISTADRFEALMSGDVEAAARDICELAARVIGCERVNMWVFNEDETELRCIESYEATPARHSSGMVLRQQDFEAEFDELRHGRYVDADDPLTDPRTAGYVEGYVKPLGITSMLDAVIRAAGRNLGLLCLEHVNQPHHWEEDEIGFACHLADKLGLALMTRERLQAADRIRESEAALAEAQAIAKVGSWTFDFKRRELHWSRETYAIFGVDPADFTPTYESFLSRVHPDDRDRVERLYLETVATRSFLAIDHAIVLDDGTVRHVHDRGRTIYDAAGEPIRSVGTVQDITERKHAEGALQFANTLLESEWETSLDGILVVDPDGRVLSANRRFADMWGLTLDMIHAGEDTSVLKTVAALMKDPESFTARVRHLYEHPHENGHDELETRDGRYIDRHTYVLQAATGEHLGRVWYFRDITDRRLAEAHVRHAARHDGLTGLANRGAFVEALQDAIARGRRTNVPFAVLYMDLDQFKGVNDALGHPVGDALLRSVAARLRARARDTDMVARFGGDEFALIATDLRQPTDAASVAADLIQALEEPFSIQGNEISTGVSIGIAVHGGNDDPAGAETLLSQADVALYRVKSEGRGGYRFFTEAMDTEVRTRVTMGTELREAIATGQLFLEYQPQIDLQTRRIAGVEALVRWLHPIRGIIGPNDFIPLAERNGLVRPLGQWVVREACQQMQAWLHAGLDPGRIAVNVSSLQLRLTLDFDRDIASVLADTGLPASRLELELTEAVLMVASQEHNEALGRLRARGVRLAIDDFGTGYSSLDYLRRFPVDRLKLAQEFVRDSAADAGSAAIVKATIALGRELGIAVIAEGVESSAELERLTAWGCSEAQGFYFAPSLDVDTLTRRLNRAAQTARTMR